MKTVKKSFWKKMVRNCWQITCAKNITFSKKKCPNICVSGTGKKFGNLDFKTFLVPKIENAKKCEKFIKNSNLRHKIRFWANIAFSTSF